MADSKFCSSEDSTIYQSIVSLILFRRALCAHLFGCICLLLIFACHMVTLGVGHEHHVEGERGRVSAELLNANHFTLDMKPLALILGVPKDGVVLGLFSVSGLHHHAIGEAQAPHFVSLHVEHLGEDVLDLRHLLIVERIGIVPILNGQFNEGSLIVSEIDGDFVADHAACSLQLIGFI